MFGGIIPRASSAAIKNACLLTLHWCYEVYSQIFGDSVTSDMGRTAIAQKN